MIEISVPGGRRMMLKHLVLDYNGTIALDGRLIEGLPEAFEALSGQIQIHVLTADTFGSARDALKGLPIKIHILPEGGQDQKKLAYVKKLGPEHTVCIGNGRNDRLMLEAAELGIALILDEGACAETVMSADVVCKSIRSALELLTRPGRLIATLRL